MVIWLIGGSYLSAQFPRHPIGLWIVDFIVITILLNILGIEVVDKAKYVLMAFQLLVVVFLVALAIGGDRIYKDFVAALRRLNLQKA